jgi:Flp pilus assembly pilin Flp
MIQHLLCLKKRFANSDDRGAAMAEYGLLLAFVALGAIAIMTTFSETLAETFGFASDTFDSSPALVEDGNG